MGKEFISTGNGVEKFVLSACFFWQMTFLFYFGVKLRLRANNSLMNKLNVQIECKKVKANNWIHSHHQIESKRKS